MPPTDPAGSGPRLSRRQALTSMAGLAAGAGYLAAGGRPWALDGAGAATPDAATVVVDLDHQIGLVPPGMVGFAFEKRQLTKPLFGPDHAALIELFNLMGPAVLRIGGNAVERIGWDPTGSGLEESLVAPADIERLAGFAAAVDATVIYPTPFVTGTAATVADEAAVATDILGARLAGLELCNEPDLYSLDPTANAVAGGDLFLPRWDQFAGAVRAQRPDVPITGPGPFFLLSGENFLRAFATRDRHLSEITQHYYRGFGVGDQSITTMLSADPAMATYLPKVHQTATDLGLGYRLTEANSFSNGGQDGVSNTFASALFAIELVFSAAAYGCAGINFQTAGVGAGYPALVQVDGVIQEIRPLFYGMLLAARAGTGPLVNTTVTAPADLRAHAVAHSTTSITVVLSNTDPAADLTVRVDLGRDVLGAHASRLTGPALDAVTGTTFAGSAVGIDGSFEPAAPEALTTSGTVVTVSVPAASAVLIDLTVTPPVADAAPPVAAPPAFTG